MSGNAPTPPHDSHGVHTADSTRCRSPFTSAYADGRQTRRALVGVSGLSEFGGSLRTPLKKRDFRARITAARFGSFEIGLVQATAHMRTSPGDHFSHNHPVTRLLINSQEPINVYMDQERTVLPPRCAMLLPGDARTTYETRNPAAYLYLDIANDRTAGSAIVKDFAGARWVGECRLLPATTAFLVSYLNSSQIVRDSGERLGMQRALDALVLSLIPFARGAEKTRGNALNIRARAVQYMCSHHMDPSLDTAKIAAGIGVADRTLQRAFSGEDSVSKRLLTIRLETALTILRDPRQGNLDLAHIAVRAGFRSVVSLRRAVHAATGLTPSEYRTQLRQWR